MSKARILVVEDEAIIGMEIEVSLRNLGYEVISIVNSADTAIQQAEAHRPDLIIMDIRIKGDRDGIDTAEIIRDRFGTPVVFSTAYLDEERIERAKITMPFGYLLKPIQERDLKITLEMALYVAKVDAERKIIEERYKNLVDTVNSGVAVYQVINNGMSGSDYIIKSFNKFALKHEGCSLDEIEGKSLKDIRPTIDEYGLIDTFRRVWQTGVPEFFPATQYIDDKYENYYESRVFRLQSGEIVAIYDDVTEKKRNEIRIIESEKLLREVINSMEKAIAIYEAVDNGEDFRFMETNQYAEIIMHYKTEDVIGKTVNELFPRQSSIGLIEKLRETYQTGKSTTIPLMQYKDDRITQWVENYIFKLPSGKVVALFEDTFEQKKMERALKEGEARFLQAQKISKIGHWDWFMDTGDLVWSDEVYEIFGRDRNSFAVTVESFEKAIHPDDFGAFVSEREKALAERRDVDIEHRILLPDSSIRYVHEIAEIIRDDSDAVTRVMGVVQDITERKLQQEINSLVLTNISDLVFITDEKGAFTYVCPNVLPNLGMTEREIFDLQGIDRLLGSSTLSIAQSMEEVEMKNIDADIQDKTGVARHFWVTIKKVTIAGGRFLFSCRDVTDRKKG